MKMTVIDNFFMRELEEVTGSFDQVVTYLYESLIHEVPA